MIHDLKYLSWAHDAKKKFYESLNTPEIKTLFGSLSSQSVVVCVFGKSQVGKTTLILKLSGISDEYFNTVSDALRGGSPPGSPCSPTAIIYKKSDNDYFTYRSPSERIDELDDVGISQKLRKLRNSVERGSHTTLESVEIRIPRKYFADENNKVQFTIVDLPGYGSSAEAEHKHTEALFRKYLPLSSIRILIENANNVVSLEKINKSKDELSVIDWHYQPEIYRIILTRSATAESASKAIIENKAFSKDSFREIYDNLIREKIKNVPKGIAVYPLEYGESWTKQRNDNSKLFNKCDTIFDELIQDLRDDITRSADPDRQLATSFNSYSIAAKIVKDIETRFEEKICTIRDKIENAKIDLTKCKSQIDRERKYIKKLEEMKIHELSFYYEMKKIPSKHTVSKLREYLDDFEDNLKLTLESFLDELSEKAGSEFFKLYNQEYKKTVSERIRYRLKNIRYRLSGHFRESYEVLFQLKDWDEDVASCKSACHNCIDVINNEVLMTIVNDHNSRIDKKIKHYDKEVAESKFTKQKLEQEQDQLNRNIEIIEKKKVEHICAYKDDTERAKQYKQFMTNSYAKEFDERWHNMCNSKNIADSINDLLQLVAMNQAFSKLMNI